MDLLFRYKCFVIVFVFFGEMFINQHYKDIVSIMRSIILSRNAPAIISTLLNVLDHSLESVDL